jgi:hypothetical protein
VHEHEGEHRHDDENDDDAAHAANEINNHRAV